MKIFFWTILFSGLGSLAFAQGSQGEKVSGDEHWDFSFDSTNSPDGPVYAIAVRDTNVYIGGMFSQVGSVQANNIARWDGHQWHALGDGVNNGGGPAAVYTICISGNDVYAGGNFYSAGLVIASNIARWDGSEWNAMDSGAVEYVRSITVDGEGKMFAGGDFNSIGGLNNCGFVAMWDGSQWNSLDSGMSGYGWSTHVNALASDGPNVYAGGYFSLAGGDSASNLAVWNGTNWAPCGTGTNGEVFALDYSNPYLYAAGEFTIAGGVSARHVTKYIAGGYMDIAGGVDDVPLSIDYGTIDIFVASSLSLLPAENICKFDCCWDPLGSGTNGVIRAIAANGADLWVGGDFSTAGGKPSVHFGHWNPNVVFANVAESEMPQYLVFPNPGSGLFTLEFPEDLSTDCRISVFTSKGEMVNFPKSLVGSRVLKIDLRGQPDGLYYLRVISRSMDYSYKLLKSSN